ncbi:MAG: hypothetical protein HYR94_24695 [Chloroflexi bacterium]|nr:hypothetical protein [Chloroflexota bacterium]
MSPSKRFENDWESTPKLQSEPAEVESSGLETDEDELAGGIERRRRLRTMLGRAAGTYLVLFLGLGLMMSALGVSPLANNGLMPKGLFIFVGLALLIALANSLTDLCREQGRNWLRLVRRDSPRDRDRS